MVDFIFKAAPFLMVAWFWNTTYIAFEEHEELMHRESTRLPVIEAKVMKSKKELAEVDDVKKNIVEYENKIDQYNVEIDEIKMKIPPLEDKTKILDEFSNLVNELNIKDSVFRPKYLKENADGIYYSNGIEFEASGTYLQFLMLFERLMKSNRILNVVSLKLKNFKKREGRSRHNLISLSSTIESFHYNDIKRRKTKKNKKSKKQNKRRGRR